MKIERAFSGVLAVILLWTTVTPLELIAQEYKAGNEVKYNDKTNISDSINIFTSGGNNLVSPLKKISITSIFGLRYHPVLKTWQSHDGIDLQAEGDTVFMIFEGKISNVAYNGRSGIYVTAAAGDIAVSFCHLSMIFVLPGDKLHAGEPIGITGVTGMSTGEHLHLSVRYQGEYVNPLPLMKFLSGQ